MMLDDLVKLIESHTSLQDIKILSTEGYKEMSNVVLHRFLILELRRGKETSVWLRIDRRVHPESKGVSFVLALGQSPAYDTVSQTPFPRRFSACLTSYQSGHFLDRQSCAGWQGAIRKPSALQRPQDRGRIQHNTGSHP